METQSAAHKLALINGLCAHYMHNAHTCKCDLKSNCIESDQFHTDNHSVHGVYVRHCYCCSFAAIEMCGPSNRKCKMDKIKFKCSNLCVRFIISILINAYRINWYGLQCVMHCPLLCICIQINSIHAMYIRRDTRIVCIRCSSNECRTTNNVMHLLMSNSVILCVD